VLEVWLDCSCREVKYVCDILVRPSVLLTPSLIELLLLDDVSVASAASYTDPFSLTETRAGSRVYG